MTTIVDSDPYSPATIAFQVKRSEVVIIRIFYGGQDFERKLRGEGE